MSSRTPISKRVRFEVFKRDGFQCQYCGASPPEVLLHIDHIEPVSKGGGNDESNLVTSCQGCNLGKSNVLLSSAPKSLQDRSAEAEEREAQLSAYADIMREVRDRIDRQAWEIAEELSPGCSERGYSKDRLSGIRRFVSELPYHTVMDATSIANGRFPYSETRAFKYFCGVCWRIIREEQDQ